MAEEKEKPLTREDVLRLIKENGGTADGLDLSNAEFEAGVDLRDVNLRGVILFKAMFRRTTLTELCRKGVELEDAERSYLSETVGARLSRAHLEGARLSYAHLEDAKLLGAHLQGATLLEVHLEGADLQHAHLEDIDGWNAHFETANLSGAHLERAGLNNAHFEHASLWGAHLEKTRLKNAYFEDASLSEAYLEGANLGYAHLEEADLWGAHFGGAYLSLLEFSANINLKGVDWGDYIIGEEKKDDFGSAEDAYRHLKLWYTNAGMSDIAAEFYYREKEANRKSLKWYSRHRLASELLRAFFGYGERWKNVLYWMALVVFGSAVAYYLSGGLDIPYSLYFSVISFTALGYGKWVDITPQGWVQALGAFQSFTGVFLMALLLVTFFRKWTR